MNIFNKAHDDTECMVETIAACEAYCATTFEQTVLPNDVVESAIRETWPLLVDDARRAFASPELTYVTTLYDRLIASAKLPRSTVFRDRSDIPWESYYEQGCGDEPRCEDGWVVCEIFWGGYVEHFRLTLGWFVMDAMRLVNGLNIIHPDTDTFEDFAYYLRGSGPPVYDAEGFRGLFYQLERDQIV